MDDASAVVFGVVGEVVGGIELDKEVNWFLESRPPDKASLARDELKELGLKGRVDLKGVAVDLSSTISALQCGTSLRCRREPPAVTL